MITYLTSLVYDSHIAYILKATLVPMIHYLRHNLPVSAMFKVPISMSLNSPDYLDLSDLSAVERRVATFQTK